MFTKRIGIDLGTANSLVWLAAPVERLLALEACSHASQERVYGVALALKINLYVH